MGGLTSYYNKFYARSEFPDLKFRKIVSVPMSDYQLGKYKEVRNEELIAESRQKQNQKKFSLEIYKFLF